MPENEKKYIIKQDKPCADYGKVTLEGEFKLNKKSHLYENLNNLFTKYTNICNGKILIIKQENFELYIYEENKFVMNKIESIEKAKGILDKIFKD